MENILLETLEFEFLKKLKKELPEFDPKKEQTVYRHYAKIFVENLIEKYFCRV